MAKVFSTVQSSITGNFGWLFIVAVNAFIVFCLYVGFGRFGKIRLGGDDAEKEFSTPVWFAMLFSAGMGIGIGNKGKADSNDLLIGSVAERLISHEKSIPVLIVKSSS